MKNFLSAFLTLTSLFFSSFAHSQQTSYQYFNTESSDPSTVHKTSAGSYTSAISIPSLSSLAASPQEIFNELNKRISDATTPSRKELFPSVRFKVKDEDMEYDRIYYDQSANDTIQVIRIKNRGNVMYSVFGYTLSPDVTCSWFWRKGSANVNYKCYTVQKGAGVITWVDPSLGDLDRQCTQTHEKQHAEDTNTYLGQGITVKLDSRDLDSVENITDYRKQIKDLDEKITLVMEVRAMHAELQLLDKMLQSGRITEEEKKKREQELKENSAPISDKSVEAAESTPHIFNEAVVIEVDENTSVTLNPVPFMDEKTGKTVNVVTYGEVLSKFISWDTQQTRALLEKLVNEKYILMVRVGRHLLPKLKEVGHDDYDPPWPNSDYRRRKHARDQVQENSSEHKAGKLKQKNNLRPGPHWQGWLVWKRAQEDSLERETESNIDVCDLIQKVYVTDAKKFCVEVEAQCPNIASNIAGMQNDDEKKDAMVEMIYSGQQNPECHRFGRIGLEYYKYIREDLDRLASLINDSNRTAALHKFEEVIRSESYVYTTMQWARNVANTMAIATDEELRGIVLEWRDKQDNFFRKIGFGTTNLIPGK